ncbi:hypothetical protein HK099_004700 [Clydaea vesicula]|uniref:Domain of unknown function at the cortex 1 domain-containing protein n=1 Tax=Clydaea vesicula TaxID=447962 RepID=A0AAD5UAM8_9FUNG|nr:hypothetical protein HK099_004700 [Clydaea vesicula]KAJ3395471.1 hypothetical protein HDU92_005724 [Lobulomyces angularis]
MPKSPEDYIIRVRCGPDYNTNNLSVVNVNDEHNPALIDGPNFTGYLGVRFLNFDGVVSKEFKDQGPIKNPQSDYFKGRHRRYSLVLQGRFHHEINGDDIIFGLDADVPTRMPTGIGVAIKIAKWLDPAVEADVYSNKPYIYSPLLCAMNSLGVFSPDSPEINDTDQQTGKLLVEKVNRPLVSVSHHPSVNIGKWSFHSRLVPENVSLLVNDSRFVKPTTPPSEAATGWFGSGKKKDKDTKKVGEDDKAKVELGSYEKRKKYFAELKRRTNVTISPDHIYCMDFYDAYFDINTISLKLPGVSISAFKYWDGQPLRFVAKSKSDPSKVYFTVWFEILDRSELGLEPAEKLPTAPSLALNPNRDSLETSSVHEVPLEVLKITSDNEEDDEFEDAKE